MDSYTTKDILDLIVKATQVLILAAGGLWAYFRFYKENPLHPRIELNLNCRFLAAENQTFLTEVLISANNKGNVIHKFKKINIRIRGIKKGESLENYEGYSVKVLFPHSLVKNNNIVPSESNNLKENSNKIDSAPECSKILKINKLSKNQSHKTSNLEYYFVAPNVSQTFNFVTRISSDIEFILIKTEFEYEKTKYPHTAERVFKVEEST